MRRKREAAKAAEEAAIKAEQEARAKSPPMPSITEVVPVAEPKPVKIKPVKTTDEPKPVKTSTRTTTKGKTDGVSIADVGKLIDSKFEGLVTKLKADLESDSERLKVAIMPEIKNLMDGFLASLPKQAKDQPVAAPSGGLETPQDTNDNFSITRAELAKCGKWLQGRVLDREKRKGKEQESV